MAGVSGTGAGDLTPRPEAVVSVIIPCWNSARWIVETLESVLDQQGVLTEVIVVDDGSDDETVNLVERHGRGRARVVRQERGGVSRARNTGTAASSGAFVQYLDSDDVLARTDTLAARTAALEATGADVAYCDWVEWCM